VSAPERVLVAMSGGVDSSVAAALLVEAGPHVVGATLKLWGGDSDSGCCSVADVDDARAVARRLGIEHHVFNFGDDFDAHVVAPYVADHAAGRTPNPCIECNRHLKFDRLLRRADALGFEAVATGHHARVVERPDGRRRVARGADPTKDQSYVVHVITEDALRRVRFPVGHLTKDAVRAEAARLGLATADKPDSQDVCFIATRTLRDFLDGKVPMHEGEIVTTTGDVVGHHDGVATYTVGQRRGLGVAAGRPQYVISVDAARNVVVVGDEPDLMKRELVFRIAWVDHQAAENAVASATLRAQIRSRHEAQLATRISVGATHARLEFAEAQRAIAPGQTVALYDGDIVVGAGIIESAGLAAA